MKILQISPTYPYPANDGGKIVILNCFKFLKTNNAQVDLLCLNKEKNFKSEGFGKGDNVEVFYDEMISSKLRLFRSLLKGKSYLVDKFYSDVFLEKIKKKLADSKYDVIHFEGLHTAPYALKIRELTSAKIIIRFHNIESQIMHRYSETVKSIPLKLFFRYECGRMRSLEKKCYEIIKNVVFITEDDKKNSNIQSIKGTKPFVSPAGVDFEYFSKTANFETADLLYLGSMDWKPNEDAVIWFIENVFNKLLEKYKTLKFYIIGKNPSEVIKNYQTENIIVTGTVNDVRDYIAKGGISVIPLRIGGGMRIKILELMAAGRPIVTTTLGAEGINYTSGKDILIADSAEDFYKQISSLIENEEERLSIAVTAKQMVKENYSWQRIISELINYYKEILH